MRTPTGADVTHRHRHGHWSRGSRAGLVELAAIVALLALVAMLAVASSARGATGDVAGWNFDLSGSRSNMDETTITPANVAHLRLKWAFAVPGAIGQESQPAVVGKRLYVGGTNGVFY